LGSHSQFKCSAGQTYLQRTLQSAPTPRGMYSVRFSFEYYITSYAKIFKNNHYKIALKAIIKAIVIISDTLPTGAKRRHLLLL